MANPAFSNSPAFTQNPARAGQFTKAAQLSAQQLQEMYERPAATPADTDRMSYEDTIVKIAVSFGVLIAGAAIGWFFPILTFPGLIIGFVLALVNIFKKKPSPGLVLAYAGFEGLFVGGISAMFSYFADGIVPQAIFGTLAVVAITLLLFRSGKVRASARGRKIFLVAMLGYLAFSLINVVLMLTGVTQGMFGLRSDVELFGIPLGVILGVVVILLAAYSLVLDFDMIKTGVERGAPREYGWTAAFGIMVTVVWLYLEILRLLAILRD